MKHAFTLFILLLVITNVLGAEKDPSPDPRKVPAASSPILIDQRQSPAAAGSSSLEDEEFEMWTSTYKEGSSDSPPPPSALTSSQGIRARLGQIWTSCAQYAPSMYILSWRRSDSSQTQPAPESSSTHAKDEIPPYLKEKLLKILRAMKDASVDKDSAELYMPVEVFEIEPTFMKNLKVTGGFWLKSAGVTLANLFSYVIVPFSPSYVFRTVSSPALYSYASMVTQGDRDNFPALPLNELVTRLQTHNIQDRDSFSKLFVHQRSLAFETEGFNGFGTGYKGYLIIRDFIYGTRLVDRGEEYRVISQYSDMNPLDFLVTLKVLKSPLDWIKDRFVIGSPQQFEKIGQVFKNQGGHTCQIYEVTSNPDSLMVLAMRIREDEYKSMFQTWKDVLKGKDDAALTSSGGAKKDEKKDEKGDDVLY